MAESVVERTERETSSPRSYVRLAVRGLVVAGFAGGIWLLSGSVAHAADGRPASAPDSTGPVASLITGIGGDGIGDVLNLGPSRPAVSAVETVTRVLTPSDVTPVVHTAGTTNTTNQVADGSRSGGNAGLLGLGTDAISRVLAPLSGVVPASAAPAAKTDLSQSTPQAAVRRTGHGPRTSADTTVVGLRRIAADVRYGTATTGTAPTATVANVAGSATTAVAHPAGGPLQRANGNRHGYRLTAGSDRHPSRSVYRADVVGSRHGPVHPQRAPFPAYPDSDLLPTTGAPTSGSASHLRGDGAPAVVPTTDVGTPTANRRAVPAAEVEALRLIAESPTVSPD